MYTILSEGTDSTLVIKIIKNYRSYIVWTRGKSQNRNRKDNEQTMTGHYELVNVEGLHGMTEVIYDTSLVLENLDKRMNILLL